MEKKNVKSDVNNLHVNLSSSCTNTQLRDKGNKIVLKCFMAIARSMMNIKDLDVYICENEPDVIEITKTWGKEKIADSELSLVG